MTPVRSLLAICATSGFLVLSHAEASEELSHDIAAQPLAQALSEFATQTGLQLVYVSGIAATQTSKRAVRGLPAADALQRLLEDTGLPVEGGDHQAENRLAKGFLRARRDGETRARVTPGPPVSRPLRRPHDTRDPPPPG